MIVESFRPSSAQSVVGQVRGGGKFAQPAGGHPTAHQRHAFLQRRLEPGEWLGDGSLRCTSQRGRRGRRNGRAIATAHVSSHAIPNEHDGLLRSIASGNATPSGAS